jgi:galactokinase
MDQFSIIKGKAQKLILLNCATLKFEFFQFEFDDYSIILLNSNVKHNLSESEYNFRRKECEQALEIIQKHHSGYNYLADVPENIIDELKDDLTDKLYKRAIFVSQENARVLKSVTQLKKREIVKFGELMYESHDGLSKKYEVSSPELDFLVELTKDLPYVIGSRMMGGGFGGSTINIVEKKFINEFLSLAREKYKSKFNHNLISLEVEISDGVGRANFI